MDGLDTRSIGIANLPDLVTPSLMAGAMDSRITLPSETAEEMTRAKLAYFHDRMAKGASAMGAYRDHRVCGVLEYYPIEVAPAPVRGNDLFVINSMEVPDDEDRAEIEKELVASCVKHWSSRKGVVVLSHDEPWDALGFEEVARGQWPDGSDLTLWLMKFWEVEEPRLAPKTWNAPIFRGKVRIDILDSAACPWNLYVGDLVAGVAGEMGKQVLVERTDCDLRETFLPHGVSAGIAVNNAFQPWLRPHRIPTAAEIHDTIEDIL